MMTGKMMIKMIQNIGLQESKIDKITQVHDYLDNLDAVGKVISFASMVRVAEDLSGGQKLQGLEMGVLYTKIPDSIRKEIIDPYISIEVMKQG